MNHKLIEVDRKAAIMREKHIELTEVNARLESQKLALSLEISDQERLLNGLRAKLAAYQSDEEKLRQDNLKLQKSIEDELKSLSTTEEDLKRKLVNKEDETRRKKEDIDRVKTDLQRAKEENSELLRVWERLKDSGDVLGKKREELLAILSEQKRLAESAEKIRAVQDSSKMNLESQKKELADQYTIRIEYLKDENKRRIDTLKRSKEREILEKQRVLEEMKSKYDELERQERQHLEQVNSIRQEKVKYQQMAESRTDKDKELQELEQKLDGLRKTLREKEDALTLINDPRADLNKISAELIKLEGKRIDLESTKSRLEDELANTERQNKALEETINKKKDSLMQTTSQKQDTLKEAQTNTEFQIMALKKEQAELKAKISELLKLNEEEHESQKTKLRERKAMYEAELSKKNLTIGMLKQKFFGTHA